MRNKELKNEHIVKSIVGTIKSKIGNRQPERPKTDWEWEQERHRTAVKIAKIMEEGARKHAQVRK